MASITVSSSEGEAYVCGDTNTPLPLRGVWLKCGEPVVFHGATGGGRVARVAPSSPCCVPRREKNGEGLGIVPFRGDAHGAWPACSRGAPPYAAQPSLPSLGRRIDVKVNTWCHVPHPSSGDDGAE